MKSWDAKDHQEIVLVISAPKSADEQITQIHRHQDGALITVMGVSFGFANPRTYLLRGEFNIQNITNMETDFMLKPHKVGDNGYTSILGFEPHGFVTQPLTMTFAFAITVGQRFDGVVTPIDHKRCKVKLPNGGRINLDEFPNEVFG